MSNLTQTERDELEALRAQVAGLKAPKALSFKVTEKGGVSVYGLQRFPVTLYPNQWAQLNDSMANLMAFMEKAGLDTTAGRPKVK